jgi:cytidine deaminase
MKKININIEIEHLTMDELNEGERELVNTAIQATNNSYANYSHFYVGAAVRLENGLVVIGANQENAAFPSGLCAERTAIFAAQAQHPDQPITTLALAARNDNGLLASPVTPCGACRQVILEIEDRYKRPIRILLYGTEGVYCIKSVKDLLPLSFVDANMK